MMGHRITDSPIFDVVRDIEELRESLAPGRSVDTPPLYLPWSQRFVNPFTPASSGLIWGDMAVPWEISIIAVYLGLFVGTTNNGGNYWTVTLRDTAATVLATVNTSANTVGTWTRMAVTTGITQPASTAVQLTLNPVVTGAPGNLFIAPAIAVLRIGN